MARSSDERGRLSFPGSGRVPAQADPRLRSGRRGPQGRLRPDRCCPSRGERDNSPAAARVRHAGPLARLTPHERSVLELIGPGLANRQIGERLFLAEKMVKNYVSTLFGKLGLKQRTAAAAYAARTFNGRTVEPGGSRH